MNGQVNFGAVPTSIKKRHYGPALSLTQLHFLGYVYIVKCVIFICNYIKQNDRKSILGENSSLKSQQSI